MSKRAVLLAPLFIIVLNTGPFLNGSIRAYYIKDLNDKSALEMFGDYTIISQDSLLSNNSLPGGNFFDSSESETDKPKEIIETLITAYTSSLEETDDTPFITASGSYVRFGVVAANFLPIGTKIRLPELFEDQIFIVEDRLHEKYGDRIDVWLPTKEKAVKFGNKIAKVEIF